MTPELRAELEAVITERVQDTAQYAVEGRTFRGLLSDGSHYEITLDTAVVRVDLALELDNG